MKEKVLSVLKGVRPDLDFESIHDLVDGNYIDSFDTISIVTELMDTFDIYIDADDIEPENLNSLDSICELVQNKLNEK